MKYTKLIGLAFIALLAINSSAVAELKFKFGVYAADKPTEVIRQFGPTLKAWGEKASKAFGEPVSFTVKVAKTYEEGISDLAEGKVDVARFGPVSYVEAKKLSPGIEVLAMESEKGSKTFKGVIAVSSKGDIKSVEQLKGKRFAFGDKLSTIGRYLAQDYLINNGIHARDLKEYDYLERHDTVGSAVAAGQYDAGALKIGTFKKLVEKGEPLRILVEFDNVTKPWIARSGLDENTLKRLKDSLMVVNDSKALESLGFTGFLDGGDQDYAPTREAMTNNHMFFE